MGAPGIHQDVLLLLSLGWYKMLYADMLWLLSTGKGQRQHGQDIDWTPHPKEGVQPRALCDVKLCDQTSCFRRGLRQTFFPSPPSHRKPCVGSTRLWVGFRRSLALGR